jgi:hypothetical protein
MSEPFASFAQSFRIFISSLLAFSSSGIVAIIYLSKEKASGCIFVKYAAIAGFTSFSITILLLVIFTYFSMKDEVDDGKTSNSKSQRIINEDKFSQSKFVLFVFGFGLISLISLFIGTLFY